MILISLGELNNWSLNRAVTWSIRASTHGNVPPENVGSVSEFHDGAISDHGRCSPDTRHPAMTNMTTVEIKAFVPARDFDLSKRFYQDLGFTLAWSSDDLAYFRHGQSSFLLQNFYIKEHAGNFMMHLLVEDLDAWWRHVESQNVVTTYGVMAQPPADRPWGMRDFVIVDPTGVLWRIAQNIPKER
jgi:catechol 2,3-dioxygenase-like lactoylglutathione lyase family enzyme